MTGLNKLLDHLSEFFAQRKGLLPLLGLLLILINLVISLVAPQSWLATTNLLLQLGLILAIIGFLLAWAL